MEIVNFYATMLCQRTTLGERIRIQDTEDRREIGGGGRMGIWRGQEMTDLRASMYLTVTKIWAVYFDHTMIYSSK